MRGDRIDLDMPELIDMLVATVEAGIAFGSSLRSLLRSSALLRCARPRRPPGGGVVGEGEAAPDYCTWKRF